ncbi:hypothetical protein U8C35_29000 (plasmid) [Sinorhizobium medicae]|nr:hypothetical protein [Sinorhizobium medicae]WQO62161.1 hypothetical protein U8C35_29000 [Sinorhizobium medicae]
MVTSDITNANARLIGFSQYRQLRLLRPPPPTFTPEMISMRAMPTRQI